MSQLIWCVVIIIYLFIYFILIFSLRQQILGLEETVKEYENKLRRSLMSRSSDQGEPINFSKMKVIVFTDI